MDTKVSAPMSGSGANERQKYIRTFEGDIKTLKEGGIPDLAPLRKTPPPPADTAAKAPSPPPVLPFPKIQTPPPAPLSSIQTPQEFPAAPPPPPSPPPQPPPPPTFVQTPPPPPPTPLQTYSGDFSDRVKETHASMATVLAAEQDMGKRELEPLQKKTSLTNILYGVIGAILLIAGGAAAYIAYGKYQASIASAPVAPVVPSPIFVDERELVTGTGLGLFQAIRAFAGKPLPSGAVRLLYIETATTSPDSVFSVLHMPVPDILLRNIRAEDSMAGIVNVGGTQSPFFILAVDSYSDTFAGMLRWEADLPEDMKHIFPPYPTPVPTPVPTLVATSTAATSTPSTTPTPALTPRFIDEVIANHDTRVYRDAAGKSIVLYGYWDQDTLVIARDPAAFGQILQRLANSRSR